MIMLKMEKCVFGGSRVDDEIANIDYFDYAY